MPRIDAEQDVADIDDGAFAELALQQHAAHLGADLDDAEAGDAAGERQRQGTSASLTSTTPTCGGGGAAAARGGAGRCHHSASAPTTATTTAAATMRPTQRRTIIGSCSFPACGPWSIAWPCDDVSPRKPGERSTTALYQLRTYTVYVGKMAEAPSPLAGTPAAPAAGTGR